MSFLLRRGVISSALASGSATYAANTANFNGVDEYLATTSTISVSGSISYGGWVKQSSSRTGFSGMWGMYNGFSTTSSSFGSTWWTTDKPSFYFVNGTSGVQFDSLTALNLDQWYYLMCVYNGSTVKIYHDGVEDNSVAYSAGFNAPTQVFKVGKDIDGQFLGSMMYPQLYDKALSAAEVLEAYNSGNPKCYASLSSGLKTDLKLYPRAGNFDGNTGDELVDQSGSGNTLTNYNATPFTGSGLSVEC